MDCSALLKIGAVLFLLSLNVRLFRGENQTTLMQQLFSSYENTLRPVCGQDEPIEVKVGLAIRQIIELDEPKQILYLNAWLRLVWYDCHLQWNPVQYGNISNLIFPYSKVWSPDITLYDNAEGMMPGERDYRVNVHSDGSVTYNYPTIISVLCKIDVTYFPFDLQKCPMKFGSWAYNGYELNVTNRDAAGDVTAFVPNTEFDLTAMPLQRNVAYYGCCPEPYPDVTFTIYLKRKPLFYVFNLLFPCVLITTVALLGFLLPPDAGEKISLEITVLLSLAVFLLVVSETLPPTSETFPYIGMYFACAMLLVSLSTVLTVVVLNVHHKEHRQLPGWMKAVFLRHLAAIMCFKDDTTDRSSPRQQLQRSHFNQRNSFTVKRDNSHSISRQDKTNFPNATNGSLRQQISIVGEDNSSPSDMPLQLTPLMQILNDQLRLMKKADARKEGKQIHDVQRNEWRIVAIVLDRLFLLLFLLISLITSLVVLVPLAQRE